MLTNGNPQCEDGYTKIANELLDAIIRIRIPGVARQVFDCILRKTYGWRKKSDIISTSQIREMTGLSRMAIHRAVKILTNMRLVTVSQNGNGYPSTFSINKHYGKWEALPKKDTAYHIRDARTQNVTQRTQEVTHKRQEKNNIQKKEKPSCPNSKIFGPESDEIRLSSVLFGLIRNNNPQAKEPNFQTWAKHIDLMIRVDKRKPEDIERLIRWTQADPFWMCNILSTEKLRKQYDQLSVKEKNGTNQRSGGSQSIGVRASKPDKYAHLGRKPEEM
jgi:phage replication O-like protein O